MIHMTNATSASDSEIGKASATRVVTFSLRSRALRDGLRRGLAQLRVVGELAALHDPLQEVDPLHEHRLVEPERLAGLLLEGRGAVLAARDAGRVDRGGEEEQEGHQAHHDDEDEAGDEPSHDVRRHGS
jgi:hypothetical protein